MHINLVRMSYDVLLIAVDILFIRNIKKNTAAYLSLYIILFEVHNV